MVLIDDVRDYLQEVIEKLESMSNISLLELDISELRKEASRLSSIIVKRDNFNPNVKVLGSAYKVSYNVMRGAVGRVMYDDIHDDSFGICQITKDRCDEYNSCSCYNCWDFKNYRKYNLCHFRDKLFNEGYINDLIIQHHNMMLILRDENSTKEQRELADSQRELTLTIARQIALKELNKFYQQKKIDYETSKQ